MGCMPALRGHFCCNVYIRLLLAAFDAGSGVHGRWRSVQPGGGCKESSMSTAYVQALIMGKAMQQGEIGGSRAPKGATGSSGWVRGGAACQRAARYIDISH
uniref:Uncharacterized protein n=1 Tax=Strombidinopsis acuminata TaxID=141414 RepID=A0A7S3T091_9SPIT